MLIILYILGLLITLAGIILLVKPDVLLDFITHNADNPVLLGFAIVTRLLLGLLLLTYASVSRFPNTIIFFGWIAIIAAVAIAWMGQARFTELIRWIADEVAPYGRIGGGVALVFGLFLLYAFL